MNRTPKTMDTSGSQGLRLRPADQRGRTKIGWLNAKHSFSFGNYFDPENRGFRSLRVINDDRIAPGGGFGEHGHADMEIVTWVLEGALEHKDSLGHGGVIRPGDLQAMTAGAGIRHSEFNASADEPVHLLQIWIRPEAAGLPPAYDQRQFPLEGPGGRINRWQTIAAPAQGSAEGGADSQAASTPPLRIHQDATLTVTELTPEATVQAAIPSDRHGYLHAALGELTLDVVLPGGQEASHALTEGDAVELPGGSAITLRGGSDVGLSGRSQALLFDLA